eukprot:gnl/MRDRNA2_/MRDRNA2_82750_c0_seq1.p1 gnl/MRDRNA2_/MRDRNA2_82750_c0~~gnl/MRDRNA2_/MRDRNA2_82750_c0_seq1.p1  ORF type:complete len:246 (+),score=37.83 gnl/MRDRNA2_/MRDRNA2_82750_c0_seq1:51-788(+)
MGEGAEESNKDEDGDSYKSTLIVALVVIFSLCAVLSAICAILSYFHRRRREMHQQRRVTRDPWDHAFTPPPNPATMVGMPQPTADTIATGHTVPYEKFKVHRVGGTLHKAELLVSAPVKPETETEDGTKVADGKEACQCPSKPDAMDDSIACCEICCDNTANIVLLPCGHGDLCRQCTMAIWRRTGGFCHVCRQQIQRILELEEPLKVGVVDGSISVNAFRIAPDVPQTLDTLQTQDVDVEQQPD